MLTELAGWALFAAQQPQQQSQDLLPLILTGVISIVGALATGGLAKVGIDWWLRRSTRRKTEAEADKTGAEGAKARAEAAKLATEGEIAESADLRAWAEQFRQDAADARADAASARADANAARADARQAQMDADQCARDRTNDREELADVKRELKRLYTLIASCQAGQVCPVADRLTGG